MSLSLAKKSLREFELQDDSNKKQKKSKKSKVNKTKNKKQDVEDKIQKLLLLNSSTLDDKLAQRVRRLQLSFVTVNFTIFISFSFSNKRLKQSADPSLESKSNQQRKTSQKSSKEFSQKRTSRASGRNYKDFTVQTLNSV